jgi:eukaryotic-like serine/threonine-protein kinase
LELTKEPAPRLIYSFGAFQLDPTERRLVCDGREVRLPPKVFELLVILVERHGLLVEKDDLMKALWPDMFVEEITLTGNISRLRKALGDAPGQDESQYIETVSKRGYRFIANVAEVAQPAASAVGLQEAEALSIAPATPSKDGWQKRRPWIALPRLGLLLGGVLLGALVVMGIVYIKLKNAASADTVVRSTILPPSGSQFADIFDEPLGAPAISPDGKQLVSPVKDGRGNSFLWLRSLNESGEGRRLPGTEGGGNPFWSPDGRSIGFFTEGKLKRIDSNGSGLQVLCDGLPGAGRGGAWSPEGIILFTPSMISALYEIPANGGTPRQITNLNTSRGEAIHSRPVFLADGKHFLFFVRSNINPEITGVYAGSLDSKDYHMVVRTSLGPAFEAGGTILYVRDGAVVAQPFDERKLVTTGEPTVLPDRVGTSIIFAHALFGASRAGVLAYYPANAPRVISWYERDGRRGDPLDSGDLFASPLSPDGTHALVTIAKPDVLGSDLWNFDLSRGTKTRLTSGPGSKEGVWQPDGQFVLFMSQVNDVSRIVRIKSDGTGEAETVLETTRVAGIPSSVCRDSRYLAYTRVPLGSQPAVWILPLTGDRKPFALVQSQFTNKYPAFSPDCKWVAYTSDETGQLEVYIIHFPEITRKYEVSTQGGTHPHWRGDGRELFYFSVPQNSMMAVNVDEKGEEISLGSPRALFHPAGRIQPTTGIFDVTSDGRRFLIMETNSPSGTVPLTLVTNWEAELKKR